MDSNTPDRSSFLPDALTSVLTHGHAASINLLTNMQRVHDELKTQVQGVDENVPSPALTDIPINSDTPAVIRCSPPKGRDFLSNMPLKIRTLICEYLCNHCALGWQARDESKRKSHNSSETLLSLCLVSGAVREAAQPILYHFFCDPSDRDRDGPKNNSWIPSAAEFPCLKELDMRATRREDDFDKEKVSAFLCNSPRLERLVLSSFLTFHPSFYEAVGKIKHLTMADDWRDGHVFPYIEKMAKEMPILETLTLCTPPTPAGREPKIKIGDLLSLKDSLRSLTLHKGLVVKDVPLLAQFAKIEELDLSVTAPMVVDGKCILPSPSLKRLILRQPVCAPDTLVCQAVSKILQSLDRYAKLEAVHIVLRWHPKSSPKTFRDRLHKDLGQQDFPIPLHTKLITFRGCCSSLRSWGLADLELEQKRVKWNNSKLIKSQ